MILRSRQTRATAALFAAAAAAGVAAALGGLGAPGVSTAQAFFATHCTRYAPVVSTDVNCNVWGTIAGGNTNYTTPSTALRDSNRITMAASRSWTLCYPNDFCASGSGTSGVIGASDTYRTARCRQAGAAVEGRCRTNWHD